MTLSNSNSELHLDKNVNKYRNMYVDVVVFEQEYSDMNFYYNLNISS